MQKSVEILLKRLDAPPGRVLAVNCASGDLELARRWAGGAGSAVRTRRWSAAQAIRAAGLALADGVFPVVGEGWDTVVLPLENGRGFARAMMASAVRSARTGGSVLVAGEVRAGVRTFEVDAAALGRVESLYTGSGCRIFRLEVSDPPAGHTYPISWADPPDWRPVEFEVRGRRYVQWTHPGVFSADHLDEGTAFLLSAMEDISPGAKVLDACCGAGAVGLVAAADWNAEVCFSDDDLLAIDACRRTAGSLPNAQVVAADLTAKVPGSDYDVVLCNPPFHQGHAEDRSFVPRFVRAVLPSLTRRRGGGRIVLVANRFLPYQQPLENAFTEVRVVREDRQWRVWEAAKPKA